MEGYLKRTKMRDPDAAQVVETDCEVLLPMYEEYGLEMFSHLDAEYACVIYDKGSGKVIAARDPIGIRPFPPDFAPSAAEFQKEAQKRIRELHCYDVLRADRCIAANSLEARVPFGDLD